MRGWDGGVAKRVAAASFTELEQVVSEMFPETQSREWRLYYITDTRNVHDSLSRVSDDTSLEEYLALYNRPTLLVYFADKSPSHSPTQSSVHQRDYHSQSSGSSNDRNKNAHDNWAELVRERDGKKCVFSDEAYVYGKRNLQAAHIFGVNSSTKKEREQAGVRNVYDPRNGIMLCSLLHHEFDKHGWCMDKEGTFHLSSRLQHDERFKHFIGKKIRRPSGEDLSIFPSASIFEARYQRFLQKTSSSSSSSSSSPSSSTRVVRSGVVKSHNSFDTLALMAHKMHGPSD